MIANMAKLVSNPSDATVFLPRCEGVWRIVGSVWMGGYRWVKANQSSVALSCFGLCEYVIAYSILRFCVGT